HLLHERMIGTEQLDHETQRVGHFQLLEVLVNRRRRIQREFERSATRLGVLRQALRVWFSVLLSETDQTTRKTEEHAVESGSLIEDAAFANVSRISLLRFRDRVPRLAVHLLPFGVAGDG